MHPVLLEMGGYVIPTYGAATVFAFFVCLFSILRTFPRETLSYFDVYNFFLIVMLVIVGSNFIQLLASQNFNLRETLKLFHFFSSRGNFASYPTMIASLILMYGYCKIRHIPYLATLDFFFPYTMLALAIQRTFGCFMAGCCYGLPTTVPWGIRFPEFTSAGRAFPHLFIHPTQLYYGLSAFAIWLLLINYKRIYQDDNRQAGEISAIGLMLLSITYFFITFFRGDAIPMLDGYSLTLGQWGAIGLFLVGTILHIVVRLRKQNYP